MAYKESLQRMQARLRMENGNPNTNTLVAGEVFFDSSVGEVKQYDGTSILVLGSIRDGVVSTTSTFSSEKITELLDAIAAGVDWLVPVLEVQVDDTLDPTATPTLGDRYAINDASNLNANFGTITGVANGDIVEYDGEEFIISYDASADTNGAFVYSVNDGTLFVNSSGTSWNTFLQFATQEETEARTSVSKIVNPAGLKSFLNEVLVEGVEFVADTPKVINHPFGNDGIISRVAIFDEGSNDIKYQDVSADNNGNGTISVTLLVTGTFDVSITGRL